jgi:hypothetical protein
MTTMNRTAATAATAVHFYQATNGQRFPLTSLLLSKQALAICPVQIAAFSPARKVLKCGKPLQGLLKAQLT